MEVELKLPVKARRLKLSRGMTIEQAFQAILFNCLAQIEANQDQVAQHYDAESLHQMRVGLRRLRSARALFKKVLAWPDDLRHELDWLADQLDEARDWDVFCDSTLAAVAAVAPPESGLDEVRLAAQRKDEQKRRQASAAVGSARYTRLILRLTQWADSCGWRASLARDARAHLRLPVAKFVAATLARHQRRLLKRGKALPGAQPAERHQVRIAAKKARYASEFFAALCAPKAVRAYVAALADLQDELGWLNDVAVADRLLREMQDGQEELAGSAGFMRGYLVSFVQRDEKPLLKLWKKFVAVPLPS